MGESKSCNVAGFPINHSLSPYLFVLVHEHLGMSWEIPQKIETSDINDIFNFNKMSPQLTPKFKQKVKFVTNELIGGNFDFSGIPPIEIFKFKKSYHEGIQWGSITSPLKHQLETCLVNCYVTGNDIVRYAMTDGYGVVLAARQFGINFENKPVLHLKGGGSAALATAKAWLSMGGKVRALQGKRCLPEDVLLKCNSNLDSDLFVDFDNSSDSEGLVLFPKYGSSLNLNTNKIDGRWMLIAQHLLAWAVLFYPEKAEDLPSLELLFDRLILLEKSI